MQDATASEDATQQCVVYELCAVQEETSEPVLIPSTGLSTQERTKTGHRHTYRHDELSDCRVRRWRAVHVGQPELCSGEEEANRYMYEKAESLQPACLAAMASHRSLVPANESGIFTEQRSVRADTLSIY